MVEVVDEVDGGGKTCGEAVMEVECVGFGNLAEEHGQGQEWMGEIHCGLNACVGVGVGAGGVQHGGYRVKPREHVGCFGAVGVDRDGGVKGGVKGAAWEYQMKEDVDESDGVGDGDGVGGGVGVGGVHAA